MEDEHVKRMAEKLCLDLVDKGKIIEAGWNSLRIVGISPDAPPHQLEHMRMAFFAGAQHLFASIITVLDPGTEPTPRDLERMELIYDELEQFRDELKSKLRSTHEREQ
jgi:hypothetical protein